MTRYKYGRTSYRVKRSKASEALYQALKPTKPKLSQVELARELDVSKQTIQSYVKGDCRPSPEMMARIEDIFGIPMRDWTEAAANDDSSADLES